MTTTATPATPATPARTWTFYGATIRAAIYALTDYADDLIPSEAGLAMHLAATELADDLRTLKRRLINRTSGAEHEIALTEIEATALASALRHRAATVGCGTSLEAARDISCY